MIQRRKVIKIIIANIMFFLLLFNVSWVLSRFTHDIPIIVFLFFAIPHALFLLTRLLVVSGKAVLLLYILYTALVFLFFVPLGANLIVMLVLAGELTYHRYAWVNGDFEPTRYVILLYTLVHLALFHLLDYATFYGEYHPILVFTYIIIITLFVLQTHMTNLDVNIFLHQKRPGLILVIKRVVVLNNFFGFLLVFAVLFFSIISTFLPLFLIPRFFNWLLSFRPGYEFWRIWMNEEVYSELAEIDEPIYSETTLRYIEDRAELTQWEPHLYLTVLIVVLASVVFILIVRFLLRAYLRFLSEKPYFDKDTTTTVESIPGSFLDDIKTFLPVYKGKLHTIRKAYAKKINRHISRGTQIKIHDPTNIIADKIRANEDIDALTEMYERVRYGK